MLTLEELYLCIIWLLAIGNIVQFYRGWILKEKAAIWKMCFEWAFNKAKIRKY